MIIIASCLPHITRMEKLSGNNTKSKFSKPTDNTIDFYYNRT